MRIVFMGTPEFAVAALEQLVSNRYEITAVYTQPDREAGRGRSQVSPPVKKAALAYGLLVMQPVKLRDTEVIAEIAGLRPDVIVVAAYAQKLPKAVLDIPVFGCVNIHPSLLPKHRGISPVPTAILSGDSFTGVSVMLMDEGWDTGPVLSRAQVPVSARDTTGSLMEKLSLIGAQLLLDVLPPLAEGKLVPQPQNEEGATYSGLIRKEDGEIDWRLPAVDIWRKVRAYQPWPGCYTSWRGRQLKIFEAVPLDEQATDEAGHVVALDRKDVAFGVSTGDGTLSVLKVQLEGKQAMPAAEFLRGQRDWAGMVLPSS
ncbi:MAG: methionyl-tRNA formyltransferase [Dehalococcoidales bacterium]|nr:MAG: methionyl-tRNA formyltransferase [Dehalococcoidales bacterium]